ncbi:YrbL family protein [Kosakonia sp. H02]|nr:YrbL family protein [Kosakonia sp. H02]
MALSFLNATLKSATDALINAISANCDHLYFPFRKYLTVYIHSVKHGGIIVLILQENIGSGRHRHCYQHPFDNHKCIKTLYNPDDGGLKEVKREVSYYLKKTDSIQACRAIPNYYGTVQTNFGTGYVFDLVTDYDGEISKSLAFYIKHKRMPMPVLEQKIAELRDTLIEHGISTMTLKEYNVLVRKAAPHEYSLVVIDNIGEAEFVPVASYIPFLHRRKVDRLIQRFKHRIHKVSRTAQAL